MKRTVSLCITALLSCLLTCPALSTGQEPVVVMKPL